MYNRVDYIVSLVGKNPMPSFITIFNYIEDNPKVFLIHTEKSEENIGTKKVAQNIKEVLIKKNSKLTIELEKCDKSNPGEINKVVKSIVEAIKKDVSERKKDEDEVILLLDYSSGTKAMSAIFYEQIVNFEDDIICTVVSYIDDKIIKLYSKIKNLNNVKIGDVFSGKNISIGDIVKLHGYKISSDFNRIGKDIDYIEEIHSNEIVFEKDNENSNKKGNKKSNNNQKFKVNGVAFLPSKGSLVLCFDSKESNYKKQKLELFEKKYYANKLGGDKSLFLFRGSFKNEEGKDYKDDLINEIVRLYDYDMRNRCYLIDSEESFEEYIKKYFKS